MSLKYKHLTKIYRLNSIPFRALRFKRSKWAKFKSIFSKKIVSFERKQKKYKARSFSPRVPLGYRRRLKLNRILRQRHKGTRMFFAYKAKFKLKILNKFKIFISKGRMSYLSSLSRDKKQLNLRLKHCFNKTKLLSKQKSKFRDIYIKNLYSNFFNLNSATSFYYFFSSSQDIKDKMQQGVVVLNNKKLFKFVDLKKGDVLSVTEADLDIKKNIRSVFLNYSIPSHIEVDMYSQRLVMLKNLDMTAREDYHLMSSEYISIQKL